MKMHTKTFKFFFPDPSLTRQVNRSIEITLNQRSRFEHFTVFFHGAPNYPFSTLHQSYPMHLVALANGNSEDVASELEAYASLQASTGAMDYRVSAKGPVIYFSFYTEAMFILCLYQYISWTGNQDFLDKEVENKEKYRSAFFWYKKYKGFSGTMLEHAMLAADFTLSHLYRWCVPCMDWHDALPASSEAFRHYYKNCSFFPPQIEMKAAAEGTFVWCDALEKLSAMCAIIGKSRPAKRYLEAAQEMRKKAKEIFYNRKTGLYGELIDGESRRYFDKRKDFWSYPQIRAVTVGLEKGTRLLDTVLKYRSGRFGIRSSGQPHFAVTENTLRIWPEKTHLLALEYIKKGEPDKALRIIKAMLPEELHKLNPKAPKDFYAESYEPDTAIPHGTTYGGDPELVHACLEGFCGVSFENGKVSIAPKLPRAWRGKSLSVSFEALGQQFKLHI